MLLAAASAALLLALSTVLVAILEGVAGIPDASAAYLVAVIATAAAFGTAAAIGAAIGSFVLYDFLFIEPRFTLTVAAPGEWLNLLLLLTMGIVVARLAGALRDRAEAAGIREREARALFQVSRALATRTDTAVALREIATTLRRETGALRAWLVLPAGAGAERGGTERTIADTSRSAAPRLPGRQTVLRRMPGDTPAEWISSAPAGRSGAGPPGSARRARRLHGRHHRGRSRPGCHLGAPAAWHGPPGPLGDAPAVVGRGPDRTGAGTGPAGGRRPRRGGRPAERCAEERTAGVGQPRPAHAAGVDPHRRGHAAGPGRTAIGGGPRGLCQAIDREAEYLNRLVTNLLDLSRIEGGALRADREAADTADLVSRTLERMAPRIQGRSLTVSVPPDLPPIFVDAVFFDQVLTNLVENEVKYVPSDRHIYLSAELLHEDDVGGDGALRLTVEDDGGGVPPDALEHLFEKFFRVRRRGETSRPGTGIGLAVVLGLTEAMGGSVLARPSLHGGLAVDVVLPLAPRPPADESDIPDPSVAVSIASVARQQQRRHDRSAWSGRAAGGGRRHPAPRGGSQPGRPWLPGHRGG